MYLRNLRVEDIPCLLALNRNNKTIKGWERIIFRGDSIGVFRGEQILGYILAVRKRKSGRIEVSDFYAGGLSASVVMWAHFFRNHPDDTYEYTGRIEDLNRLLPFIERFTGGLQIQVEGNKVVVNAEDFFYKSYHMKILERLANQFTTLNVGMRLFIYELIKDIPLIEITKRKRHVIQSLHRRNKEHLNQIDPTFNLAAISFMPTTQVMRTSLENRLILEGYQKYDRPADVSGYQPTGFNYALAGKHFYGTMENQLARVNLFKMTSRYQELTYAFYRQQLKFIRRAFLKEEGKNEWFLLDRQGYRYFNISKMPNVYHVIPRNFETIFHAAIRDVIFFQKVINSVNSQQGTSLTLMGFFERNKVWEEDMTEFDCFTSYSDKTWYEFIFQLGQVKRKIGVEKTMHLIDQLFNLPCLTEDIDDITKRIKMATFHGVMTNKAIYQFISPDTEEVKQKEILAFLSSLNAINEEIPTIFQPVDVRKKISDLVKKEKFSVVNVRNFFFDTLLSEMLTKKHYTERGQELIRYLVGEEMRKLLPRLSYSSVFQLVVKLFIEPVEAHEEWYLETINEIFTRYLLEDMFQHSAHQNYLFSTYIAVSQHLGMDFLKTFSDKWIADTKKSDDYASFIHDTGYIYNDFTSLFGGLSDKAIQTALLEVSIQKLHELYRATKRVISSLNGIGLVGEEHLVYQQLEETLLNGGRVDDLDIFQDDDFLHIALSRYGVEKEEAGEVQAFVSRMQRYDHRVSVVSYLSLFKEKAIEFVRGTSEGIFVEKTLELPNLLLGDIIRTSLGNREKKGTIPHPRKLYTKLNKLGNVHEFIRGEIPSNLVLPIISLLKEVRVSIPEEVLLTPLYKGVVEKKGSPEFLMAGNASVCCMSFGEENAYTYAVKEGFGIYNVYYKDRVIANSVLWINELDQSLVIDNIEVHPNYTNSKPYIKKLYFRMIKDVLHQYGLKKAVQGCSYNDLILYKANRQVQHVYKGIGTGKGFYTDATYVSEVVTSL